MQIQELYQLFLQHPSIQTDTRKLKKGDLFFALKGPNFNGNLFATTALNNGAAYVVVDEYTGMIDKRIIKVPDVLIALQQMAKYHRQQFSIPFIAITGSNGKTTTKELMHEVLSCTYRTYTTEGNLNNHIGIPLTILKIKKDAQIAVIEMGANHLKEIESYCSYSMPTHGIITNCGKAHLEGFGSEENIRKGKGELFDYLRIHHGIAFVMWDYDYLRAMSRGIANIVTYGTDSAAITGTTGNSSGFLEINITTGAEIGLLKTKLIGAYNLPNILAAIAVGKFFTVSDEKIKYALENYTPSNSRSQLLEKETNTIILDAYNANPSSMKAAIENFVKMTGKNKVLLLGGMKELGEKSIEEHQLLVNLIDQHQWKNVVLVGSDFQKTKHAHLYFDDVSSARDWYQQQNFRHTHILIKGSRSIQMEKIIQTS